MKVKKLAEIEGFNIVNKGDDEREISQIFCCDLLSVVMGRCPADGVWITVMGNMNSIAVATLADAACIVLAENSVLDEQASKKAVLENVPVFKTEMPIFEASLAIHEKMKLC